MIYNIGIVDDHFITSVGIKEFVETNSNYHVTFTAKSGKECLSFLKNNSIDVLLLDIVLPDMDGFELLNQIRNSNILCKVIIISSMNDSSFYYKVHQSNVDGILCKDASLKEVLDAIEYVLNDRFYIQTEYSEIYRNAISINGNDSPLSKREIQVLGLIVDGLSNKEISNKLCISELTVKSHVSNIIEKLDVVDRTQAAVVALKKNLL